MKFKKYLPLLLIPFLTGCNDTTNNSVPSNNSNSQDSTKTSLSKEDEVKGTKFIVNAPGKENDIYTNISKDKSDPSHPIIKGYVFDGWYTEKEEGKKCDFTSDVEPKVAYGHWRKYDDLTDAEKLEAFILTLKDYSGTVNHTEANESVSYQSALSQNVYAGKDFFFADRYETTFVNTEHYTPYYAETEEDIYDEDKNYSIDEVNKLNHRITVQDFYDDKTLYSVGKFDKDYRNYDSINMKDGYSKQKMKLSKAKENLSIGFESYFLGYPNQLLTYMQDDDHEFYEANDIGGDLGKEGDYYYFENIDLTDVDPYNSKGIDFQIGFAISTTKNDYTFTTVYQGSAGIAFKNGKIANCNMQKVIATALGGSYLEVYSYSTSYYFEQGDINREFNGTKFDIKDFEEYQDE